LEYLQRRFGKFRLVHQNLEPVIDAYTRAQ